MLGDCGEESIHISCLTIVENSRSGVQTDVETTCVIHVPKCFGTQFSQASGNKIVGLTCSDVVAESLWRTL
jgi:hypothetical protein